MKTTLLSKMAYYSEKNFAETGNVNYCQTLITNQLVKEVFRSFNGEFGETQELLKEQMLTGKTNFSQKTAQLIRSWMMSCEHCNKGSRIDRSLSRPPQQNSITAPEEAMQINLVGELPPAGGYGNIVTAMDVFSPLFVYLTDM